MKSRDEVSLAAAKEVVEISATNNPSVQTTAKIQCAINDRLDEWQLEIEKRMAVALISVCNGDLKVLQKALDVYLNGGEAAVIFKRSPAFGEEGKS